MMLHQHRPADAAAGNVVSDLILGESGKVMSTFSSKRSLLIYLGKDIFFEDSWKDIIIK